MLRSEADKLEAKSIPGRDSSMCKDPEVRKSKVYKENCN